MRALAEFIMRGRVRAVLTTMVGLPLISPAALALVSLRRGSNDGLMVFMWALLPVVIVGGSGMESLMTTGISVTQLAGVLAGALVLRSTRSWAATLVATLVVMAAGILLTSHFNGGLQADMLEGMEALGVAPQDQLEQMMSSEAIVSGALTFWASLFAVTSLVIARWWQALLYNPGGFGQEFHQLRMPLPLAGAGMLLWVYCLVNPDYAFWGGVAAFPLAVAGIALIHWLVASRKWGRGPLVALYVMLFIATLPLVGFLCGLALIDSWIDIRGRLANN